MATAWRNKETSEWLVQRERITHTGTHKTLEETSDINKASILSYIDRSIRDRYEPVEVEEVRIVRERNDS